ncbi:TMV resistance protein N [Bienertia sinuspersici]
MSGETDEDTTSYTQSNSKTVLYRPPSVVASRVNWDVFLSFTAEDTRQTFTAPLCDALKLKELRLFMNDDDEGETYTIQSSLDEAIEDSALAIVIISPNFAHSYGCLKQLSSIYKLYDPLSEKWEKRVIPVFYKVDPSLWRSPDILLHHLMLASKKGCLVMGFRSFWMIPLKALLKRRLTSGEVLSELLVIFLAIHAQFQGGVVFGEVRCGLVGVLGGVGCGLVGLV